LNQKWNIRYLDETKKPSDKEEEIIEDQYGFDINRPFYIRSRMGMKRVIETIGANNMVIKKYRKNVTAQQFFFDGVSKTIRSQQWKNYAVEIQSNGGSSNVHCTSTINSRWW